MLFIPHRSLKYDENTTNLLANIQDIYLDNLSESKKYTVYGLMVKHAIEDMHISVDDLHHGKVSYDKVLKSLLSKYGIGQDSKSER